MNTPKVSTLYTDKQVIITCLIIHSTASGRFSDTKNLVMWNDARPSRQESFPVAPTVSAKKSVGLRHLIDAHRDAGRPEAQRQRFL